MLSVRRHNTRRKASNEQAIRTISTGYKSAHAIPIPQASPSCTSSRQTTSLANTLRGRLTPGETVSHTSTARRNVHDTNGAAFRKGKEHPDLIPFYRFQVAGSSLFIPLEHTPSTMTSFMKNIS